MGLDARRDRLCVVQLSPGDGSADVVQIPPSNIQAPNLKKLMADPKVLKIFHFARFDLGMIAGALGVMPQPIYCTRTASRLARTYTDKHGLKDISRELLGVDMSKQQQSSDWGAENLSDAQLAYAASDVLHLHALKEKLTSCWPAKAARNWPPPASSSCRIGPGLTWPDGGPRTFSRIRDRLAANGPYSQRNFNR
jgi:ribonuclease D